MTARFFPAEPEFEHLTERAVWETLLAQLPDEAALLANLRFVDRRGDHEADLVVAIPGAGIAVLEVKGGTVTYDGATWRQSGRTVKDKPIIRLSRRAGRCMRCAAISTGTRAGAAAGSGSGTWSCCRPAASPTM